MNGIHSMAGDQYLAADGVSRSMLDDILPPEQTPLHFWAKHIAKLTPEEETEAQRIGTLTHRCILEPDTMAGAFHIKPKYVAEDGTKNKEGSFTTKEGKAWRDAHQDRPIITTDEAATISAMRDAVWRHPMARRLLTGAKTEQCLFAQDDRGTLRKARLDLLHLTGNVLPDLKTCESASPSQIEKAIDNYGYHRQAAYYLDLCRLLQIDKTAFVLICVEKSIPHDVVCWEIASEDVGWGRSAYQNAMQIYRNCVESNSWPGRSDDIQGIGLPDYRRRQLENA